MRKLKRSVLMLALLVGILNGHGVFGQSTQLSKSSAESSQGSDIRAISACNAAAVELKALRRLIGLLEQENALLKGRLETEKDSTARLTELNEARRAEGDALRNLVAAKNETLIAKDTVIANQEKLIESLKAKKSSPWKRLGDVLIGVAAGAVLK